MGATATVLRDYLFEWALTNWQWVLAYLATFACLGYALTFYRLRGGRPEQFGKCRIASPLDLI